MSNIVNNSKDNLGTMGGNVSKGIDTATSIAMGIINGDITGGLTGASAPWIAEEIKKQAGDNETARLVAHAILGAVVAELQGNSGLAGGAGAVGGEIAADIIRKAIYAGKDVKDLTEAEKQNISALAQLAAGLATAAGGGNVGDVGTAISSSKNAVENNNLAAATTKLSVEACFKVQACKKVATDVIIEIARWRGLVLTESDININTIDYYINYLDYIPDITSLIMPSSLGSPVTIRDVDVLVKNGVNIAEAEAFLNSLSLEQRRLMNLATSDLMGNKFYEEAVLKTFEEYYPEYQKKKSSNKNTDTDNALIGSTSGTASGGAIPPDDDKNKKEDSKKADVKMANDSYLKKNGFDPHKIKEEFFGRGSNSKYDIYIDKKSGELMLFRKGGLGDGIRTGYFIK